MIFFIHFSPILPNPLFAFDSYLYPTRWSICQGKCSTFTTDRQNQRRNWYYGSGFRNYIRLFVLISFPSLSLISIFMGVFFFLFEICDKPEVRRSPYWISSLSQISFKNLICTIFCQNYKEHKKIFAKIENVELRACHKFQKKKLLYTASLTFIIYRCVHAPNIK